MTDKTGLVSTTEQVEQHIEHIASGLQRFFCLYFVKVILITGMYLKNVCLHRHDKHLSQQALLNISAVSCFFGLLV